MEAKDLRIGNAIDYKGKTALIDESDFDQLEYDIQDGIIKSIELTEEWLVKFGFHSSESKPGNLFYGCVSLDSDMYYEVHNTYRIQIKHVHQLQNLYFALTGEELTIK